MISINLLKISTDKKYISISLTTEVDKHITSIKVWNRETFKNDTLAKDFTYKISGLSNNEIITITSDEMEVLLLDDIYFFEFTSDSDTPACETCAGSKVLGVTASFDKYQQCILQNILKYSDNVKELLNNKCTLINNSFVILENIKVALQSGYYRESIELLNSLDKLCGISNKCNDCSDLQTPIFYSGLGYWILDDNFILQ